MKSIDSFRGDCKLYVWLCQIARNLWCRELRKKSKEKRSELTEEIPDAGPEPERSAIEKIEVLELYKLLHALEEPLREVMYLRLTGNFSF